MVKPYSDNTITPNERAVKTIARAISLSRQRFSLILVRCNDEHLKRYALNSLQEKYLLEFETLTLSESTQNLYKTIQLQCQNEPPSALIVLELEKVIDLEEVLVSTNLMRNEFRHTFNFPLVLWVNDEILRKLVRVAPDFYSWVGVPIQL